jgi:sulfate permease, SulP family
MFPSLRGYETKWLRGDVIAGLTVWAVLVPESLAYASIAGVSPVIGLYAAPPALLLYALFGSSRHLVVGPMSATAALSAAAVADLATQGRPEYVTLTAALAITTGIAALAAGLLRLGFLAGFISEPVLKGFIVGLALTIIAGQLPKLFGVEKGEGDFFEQIWDLLGNLGGTSAATLAIGLGSLAVVLGLRRFAPVVPGSLVAVAIGVLVVELAAPDGVAIVGTIDSGLPPVGLPDAAASDYLNLVASAIGVALVGFAEGLGAAKTYAARHNYEIDANRELVGLGAANLGSGLASGMVVNGSLSKTAVNGGAGAHSQVSGLVVAVFTVITLLFLTGLFESLPEATLAAVVIAAVRARGYPCARAALPDLDAPAGRDLRPGGATGLHRRAGRAARRADLRHAPRPLHRHRDVAGAPALPRLAPERGRARAHAGRPLGRPRARGRREAAARRRGAAPRGGPVLRQRRPRARHDPQARARRRCEGRRPRRRDRP